MKCLEQIVETEVLKEMEHIFGSPSVCLQAWEGSGVCHTDYSESSSHIISRKKKSMPEFCFSSAFNANTLQPHLFLKRLLSDFELDPTVAMWVLDFLLERPQRVCVNDRLSDFVYISTGSPQGCVLSPLLSILYTDNCKSNHGNKFLIKLLLWSFCKF